MDKTAIKNYAIWARTKLIEDIKYKASLLGITEKGIADALPQSTTQEQYFDIGTREPYAIRGVQIAQRQSLAEAIKKKAQESDYLTAYNSIIEEVAYTWFNRVIAVRFMEVNDYLPCKIRVLSAVDGRQEPDIVQNLFDAKLDYTSAEEELISQHQMNNEGDKLFNMLFVKVCNDLSKVLPQLFEAEQDYTELLLNISYTDQDGLIYKLVHDIPEDNFDVNAVDVEGKPVGQVEIIGWLYQSYIAEPKDKLINARKQYKDADIPFVTQLFTSDWIVKYMVENTLGRLWINGHPNDLLKSNWKFYLDEAQQEEPVQIELTKIKEHYANLRPEDIKVIDPCMGSGHMLVYAFEILMQIYTQMGYTDKDAAISILENNLYGIDIDKRAFQLAYFAVLMKARQYHKFILKKNVQIHLYVLEDSKAINIEEVALLENKLAPQDKERALLQIKGLINDMWDAQEYGSLIVPQACDWDLLHQYIAYENHFAEQNIFEIEARKQLKSLVSVGEILSQKYDVTITNPPYMNSSYMPNKLKKFINENYTDYKSDTFSAFMVRNDIFTKSYGHIGMLTPYVWMFISSYEKLRRKLIQDIDITSLVQLEYNAFESACVPVAAFTFVKSNTNFKGEYIKLSEFKGCENQEPRTLEAVRNKNCGYRYSTSKENFAKIPGAPVAYWVSENVISDFEKGISIDNISLYTGSQNITANNERFLRYIWEVSKDLVGRDRKWVFYIKGGTYRKWYGNIELFVDWSLEAQYFYKNNSSSNLLGEKYRFKEGITYTELTSSVNTFRYLPAVGIFDKKGPCIVNVKHRDYCLGFFNTAVATEFFKILNPSVTLQVKDVKNTPIIFNDEKILAVEELVKHNIEYAKSDWDAFETSWDFTKHPLVVTSGQLLVNRDSSANTQLSTTHYPLTTIAQAYQRWEEETNARFAQLKANEEELNRIFIDIYGLQDELTPEVEDKDVTVRKADLQRDIKSLLSYAVGCMFGRYSLDVEGLAYAGGEFSDQWVVISDQCYRREVVEKYVAQELQRAYGMAEVNVTDGRDLSFSKVIAERGVIFTFGSDEKSSSVDSIKYRRGTSKKLYEGICELSFNSERIKCGIGNATYDLCSPEILNAITSGSSVELVQRGWQDADSIDWQTIHYTLKTNHYGADEDNVIPITDEDYFEDDIIGRMIAWLKVVYGAETLEENLRFIADALGTSGDTARQKIRNYFLKDFFKDHCKIYQKRPIYWLYDSGKQNGFKALIYMHRYDADTSGQVRAEYLGKMEETYESEINRMQDIMDNGAGREVALAGKRKEKLQKQLHECRDYDAVLGHIALASIAIDLDDGVKVNYVKVQTAKDGKLLPILAKI